MEGINNLYFLIIYILVFALVILTTFLGIECLKNVGLHATVNFLDEENRNTHYNERKCSSLERDGIYTVWLYFQKRRNFAQLSGQLQRRDLT